MIFLDYSAYFWGERYVASGTAAMIAATIPLITGLLEMLVFRQRVSAGLRSVRSPSDSEAWRCSCRGSGKAASRCFHPSCWLPAAQRGRLEWCCRGRFRYRPRAPLLPAAEMVIGGALLLLFSASKGELGHVPHIGWRPAAALIYLIFIGSLLAFTCFVWLLKHVSASRVASHAFVNPMVAVALGAWMLGEPVTRMTLAGMALILLSVVCILRFGEA